ncbi:protein kinase [Candidatus Gracilibacteria bacterium]|nr:protein kinase [Candidatus Gracilibacteria bacterium]
MVEQLISTISGRSYRVGPALVGLGDCYYRGFAGADEVLLYIAEVGTPELETLAAEAQHLSRLRLPQVARLHDLGELDGVAFLVFDVVAERTLADLIHQSDLSLTAGLEVAVQVAGILCDLHGCGIYWGRLRPQAFTIDRTGTLTLVDLCGRGAAPQPGELSLAEATYLAPELSAGQPAVAASDIYSWGALLFELLAGRPPFVGRTPTELVVKHLSEQAPPLAASRADLPPALLELIDRSLHKVVAARPSSMVVCYQQLADIQQQLLSVEVARLISCPRCGERIPPSERCPFCAAPLLVAPAAPAPAQRRVRRRLPLLSIGLTVLTIAIALFALVDVLDGRSGASATAASAPLRTPTASPIPLATATVVPSATALPAANGVIAAAPGNIADPDVDLIAARVVREADQLVAELVVVGRIYTQPNQAVYHVFLDTGTASGEVSTDWPGLSADYVLLYRSGAEQAMLLSWNTGSWHGVGAVATTLNAERLTMRLPIERFGQFETLAFATMAANADQNLIDFVPTRGERSAPVTSQR